MKYQYKESVPLISYLKKWFGFNSFKENQEAIIRNILQGSDTFVLMPTGGGKSLCYQLPALIMPGMAVIISPLIALMKNQVDLIRGYSEEDKIAHFLNSSLSKAQMLAVKQDILEGYTKLLYIAPESLNKPEYVEIFQQVSVSLFAIDEAHCISEWGHDFRPEYRRIRPMIEEIQSEAPIVALTATATPKVQDDIIKTLGMRNPLVFKLSFNRPNLLYEVRPKNNATREIIRHIRNNPRKSGIIYCMSRKKVEQMAEVLTVNGISALPYHAGLDAQTRNQHQDAFLNEDVDVIVATIAFGMGIDKPDVRYVIHYDMPKSLEGYYQETGRAGRDGEEGHCIAFYDAKDLRLLRRLALGKPLAEQEIAYQQINDIEQFALGGDCRRIMLLSYFGEKYPKPKCGHCDNCHNPRERYQGTEYMKVALCLVKKLRDPFHSEHYVRLLMGDETPDIMQHEHYNLPEFGKGKKQGKPFWISIFRQAILLGYLLKDIKQYGSVTLTPLGEKFLQETPELMLVKDHDYVREGSQEAKEREEQTSVIDNTLYSMLKQLRRDEAKRLNVPPYVIFSETSLQEMTMQYPITTDEMQYITGVSIGKAKRYGAPFIKLIKKYVEEQSIERPNEVVFRKVPSKSRQKIFIINCIDRRLHFSEIAQMRGISMEELLDEVDSIVKSGVKINIQYYLDMEVDDDIQEEIYDYFRYDAKDEDLETAYKVLIPQDIREEEIRLVRIAFLSELAN